MHGFVLVELKVNNSILSLIVIDNWVQVMTPMDDELTGLEHIWESLLSRQPAKIRAAYNALDEDSQGVVLNHLRRMAAEDGWHPEQRKSARAALEAIRPAS